MTEGRSPLMAALPFPSLHTGASPPPPAQPALMKATSKLQAASCSSPPSSCRAQHLSFGLASLAGRAGPGRVNACFPIASDGFWAIRPLKPEIRAKLELFSLKAFGTLKQLSPQHHMKVGQWLWDPEMNVPGVTKLQLFQPQNLEP